MCLGVGTGLKHSSAAHVLVVLDDFEAAFFEALSLVAAVHVLRLQFKCRLVGQMLVHPGCWHTLGTAFALVPVDADLPDLLVADLDLGSE